jgi:hypothetical protein
MMRELPHTAVDDVASDRNHVGTQAIHSIDDRLHKIPFDGGTDVDVADLGDCEALQLWRKIGQRHFHADNRGYAARHEESDQSDDRCEHHHSDGGTANPSTLPLRRQHKGRNYEAYFANQSQDQQPREEAYGEGRKQNRPRAAVPACPEAVG